MISSQGCSWPFKKKNTSAFGTAYLLPELGQLSAQLPKLIRLTACKKTKHTVSPWYRTIYIPWLVASYDMHKGKRWLNFIPPKPQGSNLTLNLTHIPHIKFQSTICNPINGRNKFRICKKCSASCMQDLETIFKWHKDENVKTIVIIGHIHPDQFSNYWV